LVDNPPSQRSESGVPGAVVTLTGVRGQDRGASLSDRIFLHIPAGQSVALYDEADTSAVEVLNIVGGLRRPQSGQVSVDGLAVHRLRRAALRRYRGERGLLSARFPLLPSLSVTDNVLAALRTRRADAAARVRAGELLVIVGAAPLVPREVDTLSGEQQWRLLIARALLVRPRLVLAEDPAPGLDSRAATRVLDLLMDAQARFGFTLLLATSRLATTARCDRVVSLADGLLTGDELTRDDAWTRGRIDRIG
jgi:putative ABC transport system ATP-binding protein